MSNVISMFRGDDRTVQLTVKNVAGEVYNIAGCTVTLYIKKRFADTDAEAIITKTGTLTAPANGVCEFYFQPADTATIALDNDKPYPFKVIVTLGSGNVYTVLTSSFVLLKA